MLKLIEFIFTHLFQVISFWNFNISFISFSPTLILSPSLSLSLARFENAAQKCLIIINFFFILMFLFLLKEFSQIILFLRTIFHHNFLFILMVKAFSNRFLYFLFYINFFFYQIVVCIVIIMNVQKLQFEMDFLFSLKNQFINISLNI